MLLIGSVVLNGCDDATLRNLIDDIISGVGFEDVNVVNGTPEEVSGSLAVTNINGEQIFDRQFRIEPSETGVQVNFSVEDDQAVTTYGGIFSKGGSYDISVTLDEPVGGSTTLTDTVEITKPDEQHVLVVLGASEKPPIQALRIPPTEEEKNAP